jgi:hypothetical protein
LVTVRRSCATRAPPSNSIQAGASATLMVRRARRPWSLHGRDSGDGGPGQLLQLLVQGGHVALDGHDVIRAPAEDDLCGVALRVHCVDRDNGGGEAGERFQQVAHRGDLVGLRVHGGLPEDRPDAGARTT